MAALGNVGTLAFETSAGSAYILDLTVDIGSVAATGSSTFTVTVPAFFKPNYPVACVPLSSLTIDGAAVAFGSGGSAAQFSVISTSLSGTTLTVTIYNSGSAVDPGSVRFLFWQPQGES